LGKIDAWGRGLEEPVFSRGVGEEEKDRKLLSRLSGETKQGRQKIGSWTTGQFRIKGL